MLVFFPFSADGTMKRPVGLGTEETPRSRLANDLIHWPAASLRNWRQVVLLYDKVEHVDVEAVDVCIPKTRRLRVFSFFGLILKR